MTTTGIEISPGISAATKATEELLHKVHMDWFGVMMKKLARGATMGIRVDKGERREEAWSGTHFVACEPGERTLELDWNTHTIGGRSLAPLVLRVTVEPGKVTEIVYTVQNAATHGLAAASADVKGTRPAQ